VNTLYERIWRQHEVATTAEDGSPSVLYIDLHLVHEATSEAAFATLRARSLGVRQPGLTLAVADHSVPTDPLLRSGPVAAMDPLVPTLLTACSEFGVPVFGPNHESQGIVHVIGPELGLTLPGMTIVCADSHTTTHGALGTLAFGIGTTQAMHVLATQTLLQRPGKTMRITVEGVPGPATSSKDVALLVLATHGIAFATGYAIEWAGSTVRAMSIEQRMTLCNMSIEMGARSGLVSPDDVTFDYLNGRRFAPTGLDWNLAVDRWRALASGSDAEFEHELHIDVGGLAPMVTYGTTPGMSMRVDGLIPGPEAFPRGASAGSVERALAYMGLQAGQPIAGTPIDIVFIGSCTNSRIEDLRLAASALRGRSVSPGTRLMVVPGSEPVKRQAEREGLDQIFLAAGGEWRNSGCSMCVAGNGDIAPPGSRVASTSNRNFQGRQGPGARTLLMSPLTAAATAIEGAVADPRKYVEQPVTV
jgi:3-isopropylmalate/(R)-2-methylmalate dehydratase large subunit